MVRYLISSIAHDFYGQSQVSKKKFTRGDTFKSTNLCFFSASNSIYKETSFNQDNQAGLSLSCGWLILENNQDKNHFRTKVPVSLIIYKQSHLCLYLLVERIEKFVQRSRTSFFRSLTGKSLLCSI